MTVREIKREKNKVYQQNVNNLQMKKKNVKIRHNTFVTLILKNTYSLKVNEKICFWCNKFEI